MNVDSKILETRLLTKDSVIGTTSLTRCATKLSIVKEEKYNKTSITNFIREICQFKFELMKSIKSFAIITEQEEEYNQSEMEIIQRINNEKNNISELEQELYHQQEIRKHRIDCEETAKIVNEKLSRSKLNKKIEIMLQSIVNNENMILAAESELLGRRAQFDELLKTLKVLQKPYQDDATNAHENVDDEEEERDAGEDGRSAKKARKDEDEEKNTNQDVGEEEDKNEADMNVVDPDA